MSKKESSGNSTTVVGSTAQNGSVTATRQTNRPVTERGKPKSLGTLGLLNYTEWVTIAVRWMQTLTIRDQTVKSSLISRHFGKISFFSDVAKGSYGQRCRDILKGLMAPENDVEWDFVNLGRLGVDPDGFLVNDDYASLSRVAVAGSVIGCLAQMNGDCLTDYASSTEQLSMYHTPHPATYGYVRGGFDVDDKVGYLVNGWTLNGLRNLAKTCWKMTSSEFIPSGVKLMNPKRLIARKGVFDNVGRYFTPPTDVLSDGDVIETFAYSEVENFTTPERYNMDNFIWQAGKPDKRSDPSMPPVASPTYVNRNVSGLDISSYAETIYACAEAMADRRTVDVAMRGKSAFRKKRMKYRVDEMFLKLVRHLPLLLLSVSSDPASRPTVGGGLGRKLTSKRATFINVRGDVKLKAAERGGRKYPTLRFARDINLYVPSGRYSRASASWKQFSTLSEAMQKSVHVSGEIPVLLMDWDIIRSFLSKVYDGVQHLVLFELYGYAMAENWQCKDFITGGHSPVRNTLRGDYGSIHVDMYQASNDLLVQELLSNSGNYWFEGVAAKIGIPLFSWTPLYSARERAERPWNGQKREEVDSNLGFKLAPKYDIIDAVPLKPSSVPTGQVAPNVKYIPVFRPEKYSKVNTHRPRRLKRDRIATWERWADRQM